MEDLTHIRTLNRKITQTNSMAPRTPPKVAFSERSSPQPRKQLTLNSNRSNSSDSRSQTRQQPSCRMLPQSWASQIIISIKVFYHLVVLALIIKVACIYNKWALSWAAEVEGALATWCANTMILSILVLTQENPGCRRPCLTTEGIHNSECRAR